MRRNHLYHQVVQFLNSPIRQHSRGISSGIWRRWLRNACISPILYEKASLMLWNDLSQARCSHDQASSSEKGKYMRGRVIVVWALVVALLVGPMAQLGMTAEASDKADFVVKLIDFVEWPAGKGTDGSGAVVIACVGDSPVIAALKDAAAKKSGEGTKVTVKTVAAGDPLAGCQMVFIGSCDKAELAKVMKAAAGQPVLTVSNCVKFAQFGVMVNILEESDGGSKVKFEVNTMTVKEAGLKIGAQLLKLATVI